MTDAAARLRPGVVVGREVRGLTGEQMVAAHAFVELHTLRSSGYCTCGFKVPLFGYRDHLETEARDPRQQWRSVYAVGNATAWRMRADDLRREADICDARARRHIELEKAELEEAD